ncbi:MAG TPA: AAA family ATPase [Hyphomicrobiaceae bacterium]|nr:AAA family ATPase [Hyphomicrobiaceae bacterium]
MAKADPAHTGAADDQTETVRALSDPALYPGRPGRIDRHETHGALVFLASDRAYKLKRSVKFAYMDLSTRDKRRRMLEREYEINRRFAPDLYLGVMAITRGRDGALRLGGDGPPVDHVLEMRRFPEDQLLSAITRRRALTDAIASDLAAAVLESHRTAPIASVADADRRIARTIESISAELETLAAILQPLDPREFAARANMQLDRARSVLCARGEAGMVRRCHGDLHLNNIVLIDGRPTLFDALEFDEALATIDTLYDLAFLLMDLDHAGARATASHILSRYLAHAPSPLDIDGLVALPLFLGLRSAIRAMTSAARARLDGSEAARPYSEAACSYFADALRYLAPSEPRLIAIGGRSGTGKTTLARALAATIDPPPGALHLRTDVERKRLSGVAETERLSPESYTPAASRRVYDAVLTKARAALAAGHSVVIDAVFLRASERHEIEAIAQSLGRPFQGLWLTARRDVLIDRVSGREGDASDATAAVVELQLASDAGPITWSVIEAGSGPEVTLSRGREALRPLRARTD